MVTRTEYEVLLKRISRLTEEMEDIRQVLLRSKPRDGKRSEEAWSNLMRLSEEIASHSTGKERTTGRWLSAACV